MNPEEHRALREQLGAYALGQLTPAEVTAVRAHLDGCPECRAELAAIAPLAEPLRLVDADRVSAEPAAPPAALEASILAAIGSEPRRRRPIGRWLVAAAAVVVVGAGGVGIGYGLAPKPPEIPLEPVAVAVADPAVHSTADVVPHTWGMEIKLTATGFASGRTYRVVVVTADGRTAPAGEFIGTGNREMLCNLNSSVLRPDATAFRVLDDRGRNVATAEL
ncbi:zf-HC2 domain-containing protein [Kribbella sp. NPDC051770]|uniref:anti-sigma factor family protein n=1 Tax=Kribbella sp. NPDC051770 TaxID=3155413 RepID=UPI003445C8FD